MSAAKPSLADRLRSDPYCQAALAYFAYGVVYLVGAVAFLTDDRKRTFFGFVPWWSFYVVGALIVVLLPWLVSRRVRWLTLLLAVAVSVKALTLFYRQGNPAVLPEGRWAYNWVFIAAAIAAAVMMLRAGLSRPADGEPG